MISKIKTTFKKYNMPICDTEITVGVSGGADSVALLLALVELQSEYSYNLKVVHINHNLRGDESLRDEQFVRELCDKMSVPCVVESIDVIATAKERSQSVELCARELRYEAFAKHTKGLIATAHNSDDNTETVILNLCRGTGLKGLCGIPPVRDNIIRPLIECSREEILAFLSSKGQRYVNDSSNDSDDYTRNKIRHNVIPVLKGINPSLQNTISRVTSVLRDDNDYLETVVAEVFYRCVVDKCVSPQLTEYPSNIRHRVLLSFCKSIGIESDNYHIEEMDKALSGAIAAATLPNNLIFHRIKQGFIAEQLLEDNIFSKERFSLIKDELPVGVFTDITVEKFKKLKNVNNLLFKYSIDCDKIVGSITVRSRKEGDKYRPAFRNVTKSLRKLIGEKKPSLMEKSSMFVVEDAEGIIFTNLFGIDERVKVTSDSKNIIVYNITDFS